MHLAHKPHQNKRGKYPERSDTIHCEICGVEVLGDYATSMLVQICTNQHAYLGPIMCDTPGGQHWACCPEHARQAAYQCVDKLIDTLESEIERLVSEGKAMHADEHQHLAGLGKDFHIVKGK